MLRWLDAEGRVHEWAMPMSLLRGDGSEYRARLLDGGLVISPGRKVRELLTTYGWLRMNSQTFPRAGPQAEPHASTLIAERRS